MKVLSLIVCSLLFHFCTCLDDDHVGSPEAGWEEEGRTFDHGPVGQVDEHDTEADRDAFLGKEERKRLDNMPPEKAKQEMRKLVARIDTDGDSLVSHSELVDWLMRVEESYYQKETLEEWQRGDKDGDRFVTFEEYTESFGFPDDAENAHHAERERTKFLQADTDGDNKLNQSEFAAFIHPARHDYMLGHLVDEYLERYDNNSDGTVSFQEYISAIAPHMSTPQLPEWVEKEKQEFGELLDKDGNGILDREEIRQWIAPSEDEFAGEEANHLIQQADKDKDGKLSADEVVDAFDIFIDSQVTDFGHSIHDEL